tara:strand:+ start:1402 stop:3180 length:1779 start_codon:yes stop_codon:yes gene_type:complete
MSKPQDLAAIEAPVGVEPANAPEWGSDLAAELLRRLEVEWIALVPGSSYRGLQDSLVNHLGNRDPQMLVCLHEEHAVAIAHGWAKVTDRAMAAAVHSNVGLMHATMAVYNAWCDRAPLLLFGATGPVDATRRRPWIDWIHTSRDQGALVRPYVKFDEQPGSPAASVEAILRAWQLIHAAPRGPAYICLDVADQERRLETPVALPDLARFRPAPAPAAGTSEVAAAVAALKAAKRPVILAGRSAREAGPWAARVALAEALGARVVTDMKTAAAFPTAHPLHVGEASTFLSPEQKAAIAQADLVLALDWMDLMGALRQALPGEAELPKVISATLDDHMVNGWSYDHYALPPADIRLVCSGDAAVTALVEAMGIDASAVEMAPPPAAEPPAAGEAIDLTFLAGSLQVAAQSRAVSWLRFPLGWPADLTPFSDPLSYLGADGGAGIGSGPGIAVGAALALRGSGRVAVAVLGDGDFVMGASALWTAAHYRIPLLIVIANNLSYYNDETHQETVARQRGRPPENKWIGQRLDDPAVDLPAMARSLGAASPDPVSDPAALAEALEAGFAAAEAGGLHVIDVRVRPGYVSAMPATMDDD